MPEREIKESLIRLEEQLKSIAEDVAELKHVVIDGNGNPSLVVRTATHDHRIKSLEEKEIDKKMPRAVWASIVISIILSVLGIVGPLVK